MKCPRCGRYMVKLTDQPYLKAGTFFYQCNHCNFISELMTDNNKPFGENYPAFPDYDKSLEEWRMKKKWAITPKLQEEHKKIVKEMYKKFGKLTDNDKSELLIWLWEFNKKAEGDKDNGK